MYAILFIYDATVINHTDNTFIAFLHQSQFAFSPFFLFFLLHKLCSFPVSNFAVQLSSCQLSFMVVYLHIYHTIYTQLYSFVTLPTLRIRNVHINSCGLHLLSLSLPMPIRTFCTCISEILPTFATSCDVLRCFVTVLFI